MATVVRKKPGQSDDKLIADFRKKVISDEILIELKQREFYRKPSVIKQEKIKERRKGKRRVGYSR
ncbi:30S ribosomal protein S21 [Candidatus Amesbacteria bacterium RIFOXYB1_FULL_44_23]|uniref:Small ribosomal subunit protein bS21 n=1 Tax=Candidatus Amesbacteria bacterium RIFOXYB1_FULL_44_23 TaxID=1797263 RepID=A0A1F4ZSS5_9BACT|nr:MAG: 30S ribosomal protein S21 [Candidatus Amesbacteria bacterium RIFOXYB1_FULL_44_23]